MNAERRIKLERQLLERAMARQVLDPAQAHEALARLAALPPDDPGRLRRIVAGFGVPARLLASLDPEGLAGRALGPFRLLETLGIGGMGWVYLAEQVSLGRKVAVKVLDPALADSPQIRERFRREARAAVRLEHPRVVAPIDYGEDGDLCFFAMEYLDGGSAQDRIERRGPYDEVEALEVTRQVAEALAYAHAQGLVHRDVKPANILFDRFGQAKLSDIGLVLDLTGHEAKLTASGMVMGTPHYLAPEVALNEQPIDGRADLYALGISLFEMLAGQPPFNGGTVVAIATRHVREPLPDIRARRPELSEGVGRLLARLCAKKPAARFPDADAVVRAIDDLLADAHGVARAGGRGASGAVAAVAAGGAGGASGASGAGGASGASGAGGASAAASAPATPGEPEPAEPAPRPPSPPAADHAPGAPARAPAATAPLPVSAAPLGRRPLAVGVAAAVLLAGLALAMRFGLGFGAGGVGEGARADGSAPSASAAPEPALDLAREREALDKLVALLLARRNAHGGFGDAESRETDPWNTGVSLYALGLLADPSYQPHIARIAELLPPLALDGAAAGGAPGFAGFPNVRGVDNVANLEGTGDIALGVAIAYDAAPERFDPLARDLFAYLREVQNPDGSWSTIPVLGARGAMTAATTCSLLGVALLAAALGEEAEAQATVERGALWLATVYDREGDFFNVNPRRLTGANRSVAGLNEVTALALLEARALLAARGAPIPPAVEETLRAVASAYEPSDTSPEEPGIARQEDYTVHGLDPRYRVSLHACRWIRWGWRLQLARALALGGWPRAEAWRREHLRLRAQAPELPERFRELDAWEICEVVHGLADARREPPPGRGPELYWALAAARERRAAR